MDDEARASEARFVEYIESLAEMLGYVDRAGPLKDYCTGLLMPGERKSVEPIASVVAPLRVSAEHQSLLHFVGQSTWSDESLLAKVRELVVPAMETQGRIEAWIVDDTGFVKKGVHSVGVVRQYCGRLGKTDNGRGDAVDRQSSGQSADRVSAVSARGMGQRRGAALEGSRPRRREVPDQAGDRAEKDQGRAHGRRGARRRADRRRLRGRWRIPRRRHGDGPDLCGGRAVDDQRLAPGHGASAAQAVERTRAQALAHAARRRSSAGLGQGAGDDAAERSLARRVLA